MATPFLVTTFGMGQNKWYNWIVKPQIRRDQSMIKIALNNEQAKAVEGADGAIELLDPQGRRVGYVSRSPGQAKIDEAKRRLDSTGPWYTTEQVLNHLQSLG
jgi:hypothetical protein